MVAARTATRWVVVYRGQRWEFPRHWPWSVIRNLLLPLTSGELYQ